MGTTEPITITGEYNIDILPERKRNRILAKSLAQRAGITTQALANIEHGKSIAKISTYINLYKALQQLKAEKQQPNSAA
jgi:transcriptional regulator with XRE-family HTH domain